MILSRCYYKSSSIFGAIQFISKVLNLILIFRAHSQKLQRKTQLSESDLIGAQTNLFGRSFWRCEKRVERRSDLLLIGTIFFRTIFFGTIFFRPSITVRNAHGIFCLGKSPVE